MDVEQTEKALDVIKRQNQYAESLCQQLQDAWARIHMMEKALQAIIGIAATNVGYGPTMAKDLAHIERICRDALKGSDND